MTKLCSEWAEDPIELEIKIRSAEDRGWRRCGFPYKMQYEGTGVPVGNYVQRLEKRDE